MLSPNEFDYGDELRLNARDAQALENDVSTFITGKTLFSPTHELGDISQPDQMASLVGEFLQNGLNLESLSDVKPGQEYWIHPMKGSSCSELFWPEDVERITNSLQKLFQKLFQKTKPSQKGKRKHGSIIGTTLTPVNHPNNGIEELPTPEQLGLTARSRQNPSATTSTPSMIDDLTKEDLPRSSSSSKLKRPRRREKEDPAISAPPVFVAAGPDEDGPETMHPPLYRSPGCERAQPMSSRKITQSCQPQGKPIPSPAKNVKQLPATKTSPNKTTSLDKSKREILQKTFEIEDQSPALSSRVDGRRSGVDEERTHAPSSSARASSSNNKMREEQDSAETNEAVAQRQARASIFSTTQTLLGDVEEPAISSSQAGVTIGSQKNDHPPAPTVEDADGFESMAPPAIRRQASLDLDDLYRAPSCSPVRPHPENHSPGVAHSQDRDHSSDQRGSSTSYGVPDPTTSVIPESPGNENSSGTNYPLSETSDSDIEPGNDLLPQMRVWILESTQPRVTWSYCNNPGLLDGDVDSVVKHIKHHVGVPLLEAVNCQLNVGHERWNMDMVLDDGPGFADVQEVIREIVRSAYFDGWQTNPKISMFLRPTEAVACIRECLE